MPRVLRVIEAASGAITEVLAEPTAIRVTDDETEEYARWLGIDLSTERAMLPIARAGLQVTLPAHWIPCRSSGDLYYFNEKTGDSIWHHPLDFYHKDWVVRARTDASVIPPLPATLSGSARKPNPSSLSSTRPSELSQWRTALSRMPGSRKRGNWIEYQDPCLTVGDPSADALNAYASFLGVNVATEPKLISIAREALAAPLPQHWKLVAPSDAAAAPELASMYFNVKTGDRMWEHPLDSYFRDLVTRKRESLGNETAAAAAELDPVSASDPIGDPRACGICMERYAAKTRRPVVCGGCGNSICHRCWGQTSACPLGRCPKPAKPTFNLALEHLCDWVRTERPQHDKQADLSTDTTTP